VNKQENKTIAESFDFVRDDKGLIYQIFRCGQAVKNKLDLDGTKRWQWKSSKVLLVARHPYRLQV